MISNMMVKKITRWQANANVRFREKAIVKPQTLAHLIKIARASLRPVQSVEINDVTEHIASPAAQHVCNKFPACMRRVNRDLGSVV